MASDRHPAGQGTRPATGPVPRPARDGTRASLANIRPDHQTNSDQADTIHALRALARRHRNLDQKITDIEARIAVRATTTNPALLAMKGVGPVLGAQVLTLPTTTPTDSAARPPSLTPVRHHPIPVRARDAPTDTVYLRGEDRQANAALYHIAKIRLSFDPVTRAYQHHHLAKGWTTKAVFRALKRAAAQPRTRRQIPRLVQHRLTPNRSIRPPGGVPVCCQGRDPQPSCRLLRSARG